MHGRGRPQSQKELSGNSPDSHWGTRRGLLGSRPWEDGSLGGQGLLCWQRRAHGPPHPGVLGSSRAASGQRGGKGVPVRVSQPWVSGRPCPCPPFRGLYPSETPLSPSVKWDRTAGRVGGNTGAPGPASAWPSKHSHREGGPGDPSLAPSLARSLPHSFSNLDGHICTRPVLGANACSCSGAAGDWRRARCTVGQTDGRVTAQEHGSMGKFGEARCSLPRVAEKHPSVW